MIITRNDRLIKRNKVVGTATGILSIVILGLGMYFSFQFQDQIGYSMTALLVGLVLSQISIFFSGRFGRSPRPDEELDAALKGLDDQYTLYHYQTPVSHLLIGPAGIWILLPFINKGKIVYQDQRKRWKKIGSNFYLRFFAQDNLGNPAKEIEAGKKALQKLFRKIPELEIPDIQAALVFTNPEARVSAENAPYPTLHALQLKKMIRKEAKGAASLPTPTMKTLQDFLGPV